MQDVAPHIDHDLWTEAGLAIIRHGPWAAAALIMFFSVLSIIWWTLKTSAKEVREARQETQNVNARMDQTTQKMVEVSTKMVDRQDRVINMQNRMLDLLQGMLGGEGHATEDHPLDG